MCSPVFAPLIVLPALALFAQIPQGHGKQSDAGLELGFWYCGSSEPDCELIQWPGDPVKELLTLDSPSKEPIIIFTHGLLENVHEDAANGRNSTWKFIRNAYKREGFQHFIFIKWEAVHIQPRRRKILQSSSIMSLAPVIRDKILAAITDLLRAGADASSLHLIGQNVGAHIMGAVGHQFQAANSGKIGRITGLDPSSPLFLSAFINPKTSASDSAMVLDPSDAEFVDVVHTDSAGLGALTSFGHVDWYVNGGPGSMQSGCMLPLQEVPFLSELITIGCAHARASALWAYAIGSDVHLEGCPCKKVTGRTSGKSFCKSIGVEPCPATSRAVRFGQYTPRTAKGDFHLHVSEAIVERLPPVWYQSQMAEAAA